MHATLKSLNSFLYKDVSNLVWSAENPLPAAKIVVGGESGACRVSGEYYKMHHFLLFVLSLFFPHQKLFSMAMSPIEEPPLGATTLKQQLLGHPVSQIPLLAAKEHKRVETF
uniref:Uncharacterized protein n=1 Tax=Nelumbo nucifera TaxID=4432 RepID=A0A823A194_NELNU|nr:TPA_asm: hypothetical protein HUJ06_017875 [Nelumbo nucifera]